MKGVVQFAVILILQSCSISSGDRGGGVSTTILYPLPLQPEIWNPDDWLQVHVNVNIAVGPNADIVRSSPLLYSVCYTGYHPAWAPVCKPLIEGAQHARVHFTESDPSRQQSDTPFILVAAGHSTIGTVEAWMQRSDMSADRSSAIGEVDAAYIWVSAHEAVEAFALNLRSMVSGEGGTQPSLKKDKALLLKHLVLALQDSDHPFTPHAFTCLARQMEDMDLVSSGEGCFRLISGDLDNLSPRFNSSEVSVLANHFDEATSLTAHSLGLLDLLLCMARSEEPTLILLVGSGLSNRLRTVVPALIFARLTNRRLLIIWPLDPHCRARMSDLYSIDALGDKVEVFEVEVTSPPSFIMNIFKTTESVQSYVYSFWNSPVVQLGKGAAQHVFVSSVYWLVSSEGDSRVSGDMDALVRAQLRALKPSKEVRQGIDSEMARIQQALLQAGEGAELVTVHVRMQVNMSLDVPSPLSHMAVEMELLGETVKYARVACAPSSMLLPMRQLTSHFRSQNKKTVFYVASDVPWAAAVLAASSSDTVLGYGGDLCNSTHLSRSKECLQRAVVDQFLLSHQQATAFIMSDWSTFSEIVQRTSDARQIAGCHHLGSNASTLGQLLDTELDLTNHMARLGGLRRECALSECVLYFEFNQTSSDHLSGIHALLFALSGGVIGAGFPFENWRVRVAVTEGDTGLMEVMRQAGIQVVARMWDDMSEYDRWLVRGLDARLTVEDEACVAAWATSGMASHELIDHPAHLKERKHEFIGALRGVIKPHPSPLTLSAVREKMAVAGTLIHHSITPSVPWSVWLPTAWLVPVPILHRPPMCTGVGASGGWPANELDKRPTDEPEEKGDSSSGDMGALNILSPRHNEALWAMDVSVVVDITLSELDGELCGVLEEVWGNRISHQTCVAVNGRQRLVHFHVRALHCAEQRLVVSMQGVSSTIVHMGFVDRPSCGE